MPNTADAVIIGGGVMGCSILYNLADQGLTNTLLLERDVLASGSTSKSQAILRMHYSNEVTSSLAWQSLEIFKKLRGTYRHPFRLHTHRILPNSRQRRQAGDARECRNAPATWHSSEIVSIEDMRELAPMLSVEGDESFAYESDQAMPIPTQ